MKKVLIIILSIILAISGGLLIYGVTQGTQVVDNKKAEGLLAAPNVSLIKTGAAHWYEPVVVMENKTQAERVANLLIYTAYNHINCKQFYFESHMELTSGDHEVISDYFRAVQGVNYFYNACTFTGTAGNATRRVEYVDQRMDVSGLLGTKIVTATYDKENGKFSYAMNKAKVKNQELSLGSEVPYVFYSWYDFPLDLGGKKSADDDADISTRSEDIDASLIKTVQISEPTTETPYYVLSFTADVAKVNESHETLYRICESLANQIDLDKGIDVQELSFTAEIWPSGLFRSISMSSRMTATVGRDKGNAQMKKTYKFSYSDKDCSVAYYLKNAPGSWYNFLSDKNKAIADAEIAALPTEKEKSTEDAA